MAALQVPTGKQQAADKLMKTYEKDSEFGHIVELAHIAMVTTVSNAWPERGASAVQRIKTRTRSRIRTS